MNAYGQFEGTWANLRVGALIKGEKSEFRYGDWLRKPSGSPAELRAQISRQKIGLVLHDSELSLGNSKMTLSGMVEETPEPRLQLRLRSDSSHLPTWWRLVSPLSFYGVDGIVHWDIVLQRNFALADGWNVHGKLNLADAEFRHKETGRKIDHLNADIAFLGTEALLKKGSFRLGSSLITVAAKVAGHNPTKRALQTTIAGNQSDRSANFSRRQTKPNQKRNSQRRNSIGRTVLLR